LEALLEPTPEVQAALADDSDAVVAAAAAAAEAVVTPSPARAEPHDAATWLPLPDPDLLVAGVTPSGPVASGPGAGAGRGGGGWRPSFRAALLAVLVVATVAAGVKVLAGGTDEAVARPRSFPVVVDLDGSVRTVHTAVTSATALMGNLDVGKLVAVRNIPGPLHAGSEVVLRTRHVGVLDVDGQEVRFDSASMNVDELLESNNISLFGDDYTQPAGTTPLVDGTTVTVFRVGADTKQSTEPIPFAHESQPDPSIPIGQTSVLRAGADGVLTNTYRERIENGVVVGTSVLSKVRTQEPVSEIDGYGTKADWHWDELAQCESAGKWNTIDHTPNASDYFDGGLGIARSTWTAFGGREFAPNAGLATREEQIIVGQRIYDRYGWSAWGCARNVLHWA
jgi:uncharacterized protein YabE (DUF348 family)